MKRLLFSILGMSMLFLPLGAKELSIKIDFGQKADAIQLTASYEAGDTALEVLQRVVKVGVRQVGEALLFVASIEGVKSTPGKIAWFYTLDGKRAKVLAHKRKLEDVKQMHWFLAPQHCVD